MPSGSKVARCVGHVMDDGKSKVPAIKICQTSTGQAYRTGKKSKNENTRNSIYDRTFILLEKDTHGQMGSGGSLGAGQRALFKPQHKLSLNPPARKPRTPHTPLLRGSLGRGAMARSRATQSLGQGIWDKATGTWKTAKAIANVAGPAIKRGWEGQSTIDKAQTVGDVAGFAPAPYGPAIDLTNAGLSVLRGGGDVAQAAYHGVKGDSSKAGEHLVGARKNITNAAFRGFAGIPYVGDTFAAGRLGAKAISSVFKNLSKGKKAKKAEAGADAARATSTPSTPTPTPTPGGGGGSTVAALPTLGQQARKAAQETGGVINQARLAGVPKTARTTQSLVGDTPSTTATTDATAATAATGAPGSPKEPSAKKRPRKLPSIKIPISKGSQRGGHIRGKRGDTRGKRFAASTQKSDEDELLTMSTIYKRMGVLLEALPDYDPRRPQHRWSRTGRGRENPRAGWQKFKSRVGALAQGGPGKFTGISQFERPIKKDPDGKPIINPRTGKPEKGAYQWGLGRTGGDPLAKTTPFGGGLRGSLSHGIIRRGTKLHQFASPLAGGVKDMWGKIRGLSPMKSGGTVGLR